jgi:hypothetical protein
VRRHPASNGLDHLDVVRIVDERQLAALDARRFDLDDVEARLADSTTYRLHPLWSLRMKGPGVMT